MLNFETFISICLGVGLAASVGFRVFVPLFALRLASYIGVWELNESWQWVCSGTALILFGVATIIFTIMSYIMKGEGINAKTAVCILLSFLIILIQVGWKTE